MVGKRLSQSGRISLLSADLFIDSMKPPIWMELISHVMPCSLVVDSKNGVEGRGGIADDRNA
jgi:hypothetical protein